MALSGLLNQPKNPYTYALIQCRPKPNYYPIRLPVLNDFLEIQNQQIIPKIPEKQECFDKEVHSRLIQNNEIIIKVENLSVWYPLKKNFWGKVNLWKKAVDEVSFELRKGESLGLVGESGCGKSSIAKALVQLITPTSGNIYFRNLLINRLKNKECRDIRKKIQMIFQDPYSSLNPRMKIGYAIMEPMIYHKI